MKTTIEPKINFTDVCNVQDTKIQAAYQKIVSSVDNLMTKLNQVNEASDLAQVSFINLCASEGEPFDKEPSMYLELVFDYDHHGTPEYVSSYIASAETLIQTLNDSLADYLSTSGLSNFIWVQQEGTRASLI